MERSPHPISQAGSQPGEVRHVCAFFGNDDEEYRALLPFIRQGLFCGDKAVHVVNPEARQDHLRRLAESGIDSAAPQQPGHLQQNPFLERPEEFLHEHRGRRSGLENPH